MFWVREVVGWLLVIVALYLIRVGLILVTDLDNPRVVESAIVTMGGLGVLRAGILLVRISTAARITRLDHD